MNYPQSVINRFWSKVDRSDGPEGCWLWLGARKTAGYGNFFVHRDPPTKDGQAVFINAHKFAYTITCGPIAEGEVVRHRCDTPACCNPAHLIAGSQQANIADAIERGRLNPSENGRRAGALGGFVNGQRIARFSEAEVIGFIRLRAQGISVRELAGARKADRTLIFNILEGRTYRWIPLVQRIHELRAQGIHFPILTKNYHIDQLHPLLRAAIDAAAEQ